MVGTKRRRWITAGLLLAMSLGAMEATVVSTAMPTVIATLGGLAHYSWVFSAYLVTSTASIPIWGRLSDLYGRRPLYLAGIALFLVGSAACGAAGSMTQLIVFRAFQGLGAGAVIPLAMTIVGELYSLEERPRIQAVFSGLWGVASIGGPLVGGYITDVLSWRWVFFINLPFGFLAMAVIAAAYPPAPVRAEVRIDWSGAALLFGSVLALLVALSGATTPMWPWLLASATMAFALIAVERRAAEPMLPLDLFGERVVSRTLLVAFLVGTAMFGAIAFMPLFVQAVMGGTATEAGTALTPLFLGWVLSSIAGARLSVRSGYRRVSSAGVALIALGFAALAAMGAETTRGALLGGSLLLGCGMGLSMLSLLLAIQHGVDRSRLGLATSLNQFARSIGAAVGVAVMGALLTRSISDLSGARELHVIGDGSLKLEGMARLQVAGALQQVFGVAGAMTLLALCACALLPRVDFTRGVPPDAGERSVEAGMTTLGPGDQPECVER